MTPAARVKYHAEYWPAACAANGWKKSDQDKRREVALCCMESVGGPLVTTSDPAFGDNETTALFCYLDHLAHQDCLDRSARWADCQEDYRAYNLARQADWHQEKLYGTKPNRLTRDRFAGEQTAVGGPLEAFNPKKIRQRHMTVASRHQKQMRATGQKVASQPKASTPPPAAMPAPEPRELADTTSPF